MQIVIYIPEKRFKDIQRIAQVISYRRLPALQKVIANGTPLPKGHGRLIDADKIIGEMHGVRSLTAVLDAPTIIEADMESEE